MKAKTMIFSILGVVVASVMAPLGALASVEPSRSPLIRTPGVHEIRVKRELAPNFDGHVARLAAIEPQYRERLPMIMGPSRWGKALNRIMNERYRFNQSASVRSNSGTL